MLTENFQLRTDFRFRFRFSFIELVARRLKIKNAKQTIHCTTKQYKTIQVMQCNAMKKLIV